MKLDYMCVKCFSKPFRILNDKVLERLIRNPYITSEK